MIVLIEEFHYSGHNYLYIICWISSGVTVMLNAYLDLMELQNPGYKADFGELCSSANDILESYCDSTKEFYDICNTFCLCMNPFLSLMSAVAGAQKDNGAWFERYVHEMTKEIEPMQIGLEHTVIHEDHRMQVLKVDTDSYPEYEGAGRYGKMAVTVPFMRGPALSDYGNDERTSITRQAMKNGFSPYVIVFKEGSDDNKFDSHADYRESARGTLRAIKADGDGEAPHLANICAAGYKFTIAVAEDMKKQKEEAFSNEYHINDLLGDASLRAQDITHTEIDSLVKSITNVGVPWQVSDDAPIKKAADRIPDSIIEHALREGDYITDGEPMALFWKIFTPEHAFDYLFKSDLDIIERTMDPDYDPSMSDVFRSWMEKDTRPLPGSLHAELVDRVFKRGELPDRFGHVLGYLDVPLVFLTGGKDDISPTEDCRSMACDVGTDPEHVFFIEKSDKGHSGIYISAKTVSKAYPEEEGWELSENGYLKLDEGSWADVFGLMKCYSARGCEMAGIDQGIVNAEELETLDLLPLVR
mgnify:CR=1 FL=1